MKKYFVLYRLYFLILCVVTIVILIRSYRASASLPNATGLAIPHAESLPAEPGTCACTTGENHSSQEQPELAAQSYRRA